MTDTVATTDSPRVGVLGGTGDQGRGLARRLAMSGLTVVVGSRDEARAQASAEGLGHGVAGATNAECAATSDIVIAAVPYDGHAELLASLREQLVGKILIDCVNPLGFDKQGAFVLPVPEGSAAQQAQALLPETTVVAPARHRRCDRRDRRPRAGRRPRGDGRRTGPGRPHRGNAGCLRRSASQRRAGRGAHGQPHRGQPSLQGPRRHPHHRHLTDHLRPLWSRSGP